MKRWSATLLLVLGTVAPTGHARAADTAPRLIVSPADAAVMLAQPGTVAIHIGERRGYDAEHLPGARFLTLDDISLPRTPGTLSLQMLPPDELARVFGTLGVGANGRVLLYFGRDWVTPTTRVWLAFDRIGFGHQAFVLDGGMAAWKAEGRPLTAEVPAVTPAVLTPQPREEALVDGAWVFARLRQPGVRIIDARNEEFYTGASDSGGRIPRPGHIEGAVSLTFSRVIDDRTNRLKNPDALRTLYADAGITAETENVAYCHIGQQASLIYAVGRMLGFRMHLYDGSFDEWSPNTAWPVVKGK